MRRALLLARQGAGHVHPNPMVGAVLVRAGQRVGEGCHRRYGGPHAEAEALRRAGARAGGSTLYVTLEPCSHWGKTPPCAEAVVRAGIRRVVAAMRDPHPLVAGKGLRFLRSRGIRVSTGLLRREAEHLNRAYLVRVKEGRPYVTLKIASSLDGRMATVTGQSRWITSPASRRAGHRLRARVDAIAVGAGTVLMDDPELTTHGLGRNPVRIVFSGRRRLPGRLKIFNQAAPTWRMEQVTGKAGLTRAMRDLAARGITHLLVEGGAKLQRSFLEAGLVDEVVCFIAPLIIGPARRLRDALRIKGMNDHCLQGEVKR